MKKLLAGLFALMALGLVLSGCKKDDDDAEEEKKEKDELKNTFKELLTRQFSEEGENLLGDMEITEDNISKYIKFFYEVSSNDDDKEVTSDLKLSVNEDKTKFRAVIEMGQSADDLWWKTKTSILCTKK